MNKSALYPYNRKLAYYYAKRWAYERNDRYYNFDHIGGDCTNFTSQVLCAGGCKMNYNKWEGWYYRDVNDRAPSWTSVEYLYKFLLYNENSGPICQEVSIKDIMIGDVIQLSFEHDEIFNHSLIVTKVVEPKNPKNIFISTHSIDRFDYALDNYNYKNVRYIHILGYK